MNECFLKFILYIPRVCFDMLTHTHTHKYTQMHMCACQAVWENVFKGSNTVEKYQLLPHNTRSLIEAVSNFQSVSMQFESSV